MGRRKKISKGAKYMAWVRSFRRKRSGGRKRYRRKRR